LASNIVAARRFVIIFEKTDRGAETWACEIRFAQALIHHDLGMRERRMLLFSKIITKLPWPMQCCKAED